MPKVPAYTLAWSPATEVYELYETRDLEGLGIVPDSPEWFAWLDQVSSFAFSGKTSHYDEWFDGMFSCSIGSCCSSLAWGKTARRALE